MPVQSAVHRAAQASDACAGSPAARPRANAAGVAAIEAEAVMLSPRLHNLLDTGQTSYTTLAHPRTITAHETASAARVEPNHFAKTVMIKADGRLAMVVMPAAYRADLYRLSLALGGVPVELAEESEFRETFSDCEPGAMPPFGHLYGMPVYVDSRLAHQDEIAFNAGNHTEVVRMPYREFERLAAPEMLWLAHMM
jgi:Ala-tRNA(Pro) deacylase